ncbi:hypothetical protein ZIOFF_009733 [Zingiber officinale]|uniref:Deoxyuridine 5'-triphosphate nucleotidohydrolase n=1 Tax=Zingiber officinale TaxID=94328 RepID=A0A8J5HN92_ZINOF|nr:hypothetical protein ZIOFF_009733 [Zingiber officinale]
MALIVFRDNRWQGDQAILATMEVVLTQGSQMVYVIPEIMLTIGDFFLNIQISILIRGYEAWQNGEANLLITRGLVGRLSNTLNVGFAYKIQGVVDYLTMHGVKALPGRSLSTQKLQGLNSVIKPTQVIIPMQPSEVNSNNLMDGRISLSFNNYIVAQSARQAIYTERDEELQSQNDKIIAVLIERENGIFEEVDILTNPDRKETDYPYLLVHKLSSNAIIPTKQSTGAAGLDLAASEDCVIPPRGRGLIPTGISMEISWGTYGRIAARSSAAYRLGLDIGAGVIDCDYRGEELLPKESAAMLLQTESELPKPTLEQDHARETNLGATVLQSMDTTLEYADTEDDFLEHIQYLASISTPWDSQLK